MAYDVYVTAEVEDYVAGVEGLSDVGKQTLMQGCTAELAARAEHFLERYPLAPESYRFE